MAECRYWGMCRICYGTACDGASATCERYEPMPDVGALLALADELSGDTLAVPAVYGTYQGGYVAACRDVASRIRDALGAFDG